MAVGPPLPSMGLHIEPRRVGGAAVEVGEVNSLPVNYGMSFSLPTSTDGFRGWRAEASLGAIRRRFETALCDESGWL